MRLLASVVALVCAQGAAPPSPAAGRVELSAVPGNPNVLASQVPAVPPELVARVFQYSNARSAVLRDVSEDGRQVLIGTRFGSTEQLHRVSAPLGAREQLTFFEEPVAKAAFLPGDPSTIFFLQDSGGGEFYQLQRLDLRTARVEMLTDGRSRHQTFVLSREGKWLAYSGTGRNGKDTDVYLLEVADAHTPRRLTELAGTWTPLEFAPGGARLLVLEERGTDDADLWLVELSTGARRRLTPDPAVAGKARIVSAFFAPDGRSVYLITDRSSPFTTLRRIDLDRAEAAQEPVVPELRWDVELAAVAADGTLVLSTNEDGFSRAYLLRGKRLEALPIPAGVLAGFRFPRDRSDVLFLSLETATSPVDVWQLSLRTKKLVRWTKSEVGGLDAGRFVAPRLVRYPSSDGLSIPALLYAPRDVPKGTRVPVIVYWHGGPEGQERPIFRPFFQLLLEQGMAVLAPNVRGSDGYGRAYLAADDGVKREQALADIGATVQWISLQPGLDAGRVAAFGGSYGGYMSLASAAFYPAAFRAAVDAFGISNLVTFLQTTQAYRRDLRRAEYGDERLPEVRAVQERISPLHAADRIQAALLVLQGNNDPRVPRSEAEQIVRAARSHGREVWYWLALNEGHGFKKKENRDLATAVEVLFLRRTLLDQVSAR
ncbi:MAG TPA: alpha/beta fold hydrolase [Myxococcaceae bacterium]|nr:alpha/beta fold hydrolase [Myxococcaceae bacterium]